MGKLWYGEPANFANGFALSADGRYLYIAETFGNPVFRLPIREDGSAGERVEIASLTDVLPDGLAVDTGGNLYVGCYEPSQVRRRAAVVDEDKHVKTPLAHRLLETELWGLAFATMPLSSRSLWACMRVPFPRYFFRGHAV